MTANKMKLLVGTLLCLPLMSTGVLATLAHSDPSFSVEPDWYNKAVDWDASKARRQASAALGWSVSQVGAELQDPVLLLRVADAAGQPLVGADVRVEAFHVARASERQNLVLNERAPGQYAAPARLDRPGQWELRVRVAAQGQEFEQVLRPDVGGVPL